MTASDWKENETEITRKRDTTTYSMGVNNELGIPVTNECCRHSQSQMNNNQEDH